MREQAQQTQQNHYNILTSSDSTLIPQIAVSLTAMAKNLADDFIDFYLLHSQITPGNLQLLSTLCNGFGNIAFHEIRIDNPEIFDPLVQAGNWVRETYFPLCAHQLLPDTIERALYLDAGDTLVLGDIAPYYTCDFEDCFLIVTGQKYKMGFFKSRFRSEAAARRSAVAAAATAAPSGLDGEAVQSGDIDLGEIELPEIPEIQEIIEGGTSSMEKTMKIEGMMCGHCSGRVEKALNDLPGVTAKVNLEAGTATVTGEASDEALTKAVTDAGYTVVSIN